jgi:drug/metabolite transporter (DMT)-like permease
MTPLAARPLAQRVGAMTPDLQASILMIVAFVVFSAMAVFMRMIADRIAVPQVIFLRQVMALMMMAPLFWTSRAVILRPTGLGLHLARGFLAVGAMFCGLTSIVHIPLADATAIGMAEVLIATAFAALVLREPVGWRRWTATGVGFVGVLIMIRPFGEGFDVYALVALAGSVCGALSMIALRLGSGHDTTVTVLFWQGMVVAALSAPVSIGQWVTPTLQEALILLVMGLIFTTGIWLFTAAIRLGRASAIAPLGYLRLVLMAATGWLFYGEIPTWATVIGGLLVIGSATYTITRNAARSPVIAPANPDTH